MCLSLHWQIGLGRRIRCQLSCMLFSPHAVDGFVMPMLPLPLPPDSLLFIAESARQDPVVEMVSYAVSCVGSTCIFTFLVLVSTACVVSSLRPICFVADPPGGPYIRQITWLTSSLRIFLLTQVRPAAEQHRRRLPRGREGPDRIRGPSARHLPR